MRHLYTWFVRGFVVCWLATAPGMCIASRIMESQDREAYLRYRTAAEQMNLEREKSGLQPQAIMGYEEWISGGKR